MKIIRVINELRQGGVQIRLGRVARDLVARGHEVVIVCTLAEGENAPEVRAGGVRVEVVPVRKWNKWSDILTLAKFFRAEKPDIVHAHMFRQYTPATVAATMARVPVIFGQVHLVGTYRNLKWIRTERIISRFRTATLAVSEAVANDIRHACAPHPPPRLQVLLNGVDLAKIQVGDQQSCRADLCAEFGFPSDSIVFINVARLNPIKNQRQLIDAFHTVHRQVPKTRLLIAGGGELFDELNGVIDKHRLTGKAILAGDRKDVPRLLAGSDAFVLPSKEEGFSNAILEAMAAGLPVLASDVGGAREVIHPPRNGAILPPLDEDALRQAMLEMAQSPESRAAQSAANLEDIQQYTHETMIENTIKLYEEALSAKGRRSL